MIEMYVMYEASNKIKDDNTISIKMGQSAVVNNSSEILLGNKYWSYPVIHYYKATQICIYLMCIFNSNEFKSILPTLCLILHTPS